MSRHDFRSDIQERELKQVWFGLARKPGAVAPLRPELTRERKGVEAFVVRGIVVEVHRAAERVEIEDDALSEAEEAVAEVVIPPITIPNLEAPRAVRAVVQRIGADHAARTHGAAARIGAVVRGVGT